PHGREIAADSERILLIVGTLPLHRQQRGGSGRDLYELSSIQIHDTSQKRRSIRRDSTRAYSGTRMVQQNRIVYASIPHTCATLCPQGGASCREFCSQRSASGWSQPKGRQRSRRESRFKACGGLWRRPSQGLESARSHTPALTPQRNNNDPLANPITLKLVRVE